MSGVFSGITRAILALIGGLYAGSDEQVGATVRIFIEQLASGDTNALGGTIVTLVAIAWSIYDKKKTHASKEESQ